MITRLLEGLRRKQERGEKGRLARWVRSCATGAARLRLASGTWAHPRQLTLAPVVALLLALLGCLLLLFKGGVVGGYQLVLVCALVVMVAQDGLKQA